MILHGNESRPTVAIGKIQRLRELPRVHGRRSDIANLAGLHHVVQRFKRFFDGRRVVPAVYLIQVYIVGFETTQALIELINERHRQPPMYSFKLSGRSDRSQRAWLANPKPKYALLKQT